MSCPRSIVVAMTLLAAGLVGSHDAEAQSREPLQLGAGYQWLHESIDGGGQTFPIGVYVDVEQTLTADQVKSWGWMRQVDDRRAREGDLLTSWTEQRHLTVVAPRAEPLERNGQPDRDGLRSRIQPFGDRDRRRLVDLHVSSIKAHERHHRLRRGCRTL